MSEMTQMRRRKIAKEVPDENGEVMDPIKDLFMGYMENGGVGSIQYTITDENKNALNELHKDERDVILAKARVIITFKGIISVVNDMLDKIDCDFFIRHLNKVKINPDVDNRKIGSEIEVKPVDTIKEAFFEFVKNGDKSLLEFVVNRVKYDEEIRKRGYNERINDVIETFVTLNNLIDGHLTTSDCDFLKKYVDVMWVSG